MPSRRWRWRRARGRSACRSPTFLSALQEAGLGTLPGTAAEILDDEVRDIICPDKLQTGEWLDVVRDGASGRPAHHRDHHVRPCRAAAHLGAPSAALRDLQARTGGFTEFVPLPFVHMEAPMYLKGRARSGPTWREAVLMHAVARLVLHPLIPNIQASWVKLGPAGAARMPGGRRQRSRRHADEREHLARGRHAARPGVPARGDGGADPRGRPRAAAAHDALRRGRHRTAANAASVARRLRRRSMTPFAARASRRKTTDMAGEQIDAGATLADRGARRDRRRGQRARRCAGRMPAMRS